MESWVTLATNDNYCVGALVLAASLRRVKTTRNLTILVTKGITTSLMDQLGQVFDDVVTVDPLDSGDVANLSLMDRPELGVTMTKLHCWTLTQFTKCVFLDADTLVVNNSDDLFDREEFSAAPDAGWPDCFNSGVFVFRPSIETFKAILQFACVHGSFDGGDQGLLNQYFSTWATKDISKHLPFLYNMCSTATYTYQPAYKHFGSNVKIVHFLGSWKPWHVQFSPQGSMLPRNQNQHQDSKHLQLWWSIFNTDVKPNLAQNKPDELKQAGEHFAPDVAAAWHGHGVSVDVKENWEQGRPDYTGTSAFENILRKIDDTMNITQPSELLDSSKTSASEKTAKPSKQD